MNRILVPLDFSETSLNALSYAVNLFKDAYVEITLLHIYGTQSSAFMMKSIDSVLIKEAEKRMEEVSKKLRETAPHVTVKKQLLKNYPVSTIVTLGDSGHFDFIVMGTKGASGLKEVFVGSVAGGVISKTNAPIIVVPANFSHQGIQKVILAVGDEPISNADVVNPLRKLMEIHEGSLEVLHIADDESTNLEDSVNAMQDLNPSVTYSFGTGNTNEDLNAYLEENTVDLLCLIRSKKGFFDRLLGGSVTLKQTFNSSIPLLIIHN
jgi:nucleotide-binding universal stress UspA family protein